MSIFTRQRCILFLAAVMTIAIPGISYAQLDLKGKAIETLTNGVMKELEKKFSDMVAKEALSTAVKANIVKSLSEMSRPIVKNIIDGAASGRLPNVPTVVNAVMKDVTPRVQELVAAALTDGGDVPDVKTVPAGAVGPAALPATLPAASASSAISYDDEKDFTVELINEGSGARITRYAGKNTELRIPPRIGEQPVTEIGERVFTKKGLTSVAIPESVIFIGNLAFAENQISSVSIGSNVYIANNAFDGSGYNPSFVGFYNSQGRRAGTYGNGWRFVSAPAPQPAAQPVRPGSDSVAPAGTSGVAAAPSDSALSAVEVISPTSGWAVNKDDKSSANMSIDKEQIDGREWDVLTINVNNKTNGWAGVMIYLGDIIQRLQNANGVRFKVLGDGKKWRVQFPTRNVADGAWHGMTISTQKGKVTSIDIPFSRLRQPDGGRKVAFIKNNIHSMKIERTHDTGTGAAVIKVFDFEIY